ncbi:hypothetical protein [Geothermobacter hydrogeniphilus]|uniref:Uncharacterized protein n=1 Tax=Geothermobacter hydrogeniphilus TaxID=1969733 RepID=A0A1X0Y8G9_9BACT|nr:hypothetical protein [Geothermobacter hydrogeniphilus]ORJ61324.1 hypothetical protein B5V00_06745 [Geothermobacter hydrogeniphilus]
MIDNRNTRSLKRLIRQLRDMAEYKHDDLSIADDAADVIEVIVLRGQEGAIANIVEYELGCLDRKHAMGYRGDTPEYHAGYFEIGPENNEDVREQRNRKEMVNRGWL